MPVIGAKYAHSMVHLRMAFRMAAGHFTSKDLSESCGVRKNCADSIIMSARKAGLIEVCGFGEREPKASGKRPFLYRARNPFIQTPQGIAEEG